MYFKIHAVSVQGADSLKLAKVKSSEASEIVPMLLRKYADTHSKISKNGEWRFVPLLEGVEDEVESMGFEIVEGEAHSRYRIPPQERIKKRLSHLPLEIINLLPMKWEFVGSIAIIKTVPALNPYLKEIGEVYAYELQSDTICADIDGVSGEFRKPGIVTIYGNKTESERLENGIKYRFDVTKVMFASGNVDERERMKNLDCTGETVVDMFAGIGYFTLPLAKFANPLKVIACEKNPDSYYYLVKNIELNNVSNIVTPILGDNRSLEGKKIADRILMGYVQKTSEFLPKAMELIKSGGIIHYHDTFYVNEYENKIEELFSSCCNNFEILGIREVKSFAPSVSHYVADVKII